MMIKRYFFVSVCAVLTAWSAISSAADLLAPRDADFRAAVLTLRQTADDEARRNATLAYFEQQSKRFPADPYVGVQLASAYGVQARFGKTREAKAVWAAKAESLLNEISAANPQYLLAQATHGVHLAMSPPALGYDNRAEKELRRVIAARPGVASDDDDEAALVSYLFLARLLERQLNALSGDAQLEKRRAAEQVRADLKQRFPRIDPSRLAAH